MGGPRGWCRSSALLCASDGRHVLVHLDRGAESCSLRCGSGGTLRFIARVFGACHRLFLIVLHGGLVGRVCNLVFILPQLKISVRVLGHGEVEFLGWGMYLFVVGCGGLESLESRWRRQITYTVRVPASN
jgi:hypothetical protein